MPLHYRTSAVSFRPAFPGLAANLATFYEWSRLKDADGLGHFLLSNGAVYIDHISPTICGTNADATRSARLELGQFDLRDLDDLLMFVSDDKQKQVADDFGQTEVVHKSATAQQTAIVSPRIMKRVDAVFAEAILKSFFADDALRTIYRERAARLPRAGGTSVALLAAIRSSIAGVRPKLQKLILDAVAVKPFLATGFGAQTGRIHADFKWRVLRLSRVNDWLEDERLNPTELCTPLQVDLRAYQRVLPLRRRLRAGRHRLRDAQRRQGYGRRRGSRGGRRRRRER